MFGLIILVCAETFLAKEYLWKSVEVLRLVDNCISDVYVALNFLCTAQTEHVERSVVHLMELACCGLMSLFVALHAAQKTDVAGARPGTTAVIEGSSLLHHV